VADQILTAAHECTADLIVLSTHGRTGPQRRALGSVADELVRRAPLPVLLVSTRALAARAAGPYSVRDVMTRDLAVVATDEPLSSVLRKLQRRRVSGVPVVDAAGSLVGIISESDLLVQEADLLKALTREPWLDAAADARRLDTQTAAQIMSHPAITIEESAPLATALRLFVERRLRRLPVTRQGRLVGKLSRSDVLKVLGPQ
jgi:CBS domain-containing protein